jgi:hypothetical protein
MPSNNNMSTVVPFIVRSGNGAIDISASVDNFHTQLDEYVKTHRTSLKRVSAAVNAVFDAHKGSAFNMDALQSFALQKLNATPDNYQELATLVTEYVRSDSNFSVQRGRGGGVRRLSDDEGVSIQEASEDEQEEEEIPPAPPVIRRQSSNAPRITNASIPPARNSQRAPSQRAAAR